MTKNLFLYKYEMPNICFFESATVSLTAFYDICCLRWFYLMFPNASLLYAFTLRPASRGPGTRSQAREKLPAGERLTLMSVQPHPALRSQAREKLPARRGLSPRSLRWRRPRC